MDALVQVKTALQDYQTDISGLSGRMRQHVADVSQSADIEMRRIGDQIDGVVSQIKTLKGEIQSLTETINRKIDEKRLTEQKLEIVQGQLEQEQKQADSLAEWIASLEESAARAEGEVKEGILRQIRKLQGQLSEVKSKIVHLQDQIPVLTGRILRLQRETEEVKTKKARKERDLCEVEVLLNRLQDKQERMRVALVKMNANMDVLLSAAGSFEMRTASEMSGHAGNVNKCITTVEAYLGG